MFKSIQNKLLISNPLLWNLKIIPFAVIALCFHVVFFLLGYISGTIDFNNDTYRHYDPNFDTAIIIFFSVVVSVLITIIWLVVYSRNNAFKSFYPKTNFSLFKEFLYIALFCILACTFSLSYLYAKDARARNYYSEKEITKKLEILSLVSVFVEGPFEESNHVNVQVDGQNTTQQRESFKYRSRTYSLNSLMNKRVESGYYFSAQQDSTIAKRVKGWLYEDQKDSVKWVLDAFMKIAKEEKLQSNISSEKWLDLIYDYPGFINYTVIKRYKDPDYNSNYEVPAVSYDSIGIGVEIASEAERQTSSTYFVPYEPLREGYSEIAKAYENPIVDFEFICFFLYLSIGMAIAVFSFKVTSGRNWLIAMVSLGVVSLIIGIFSAMSGGTTSLILYLLIFSGLLMHFFATIASGNGKGISGITLNHILWMCPGILPIIFYFIMEIRNSWLEDHFQEIMIANLAVTVLFIFLFSVQIKKWKGIAED